MKIAPRGQCVPYSFAFILGEDPADLMRQCRYPFDPERGYSFTDLMLVSAMSLNRHFTYFIIDDGEHAFYEPELSFILNDGTYEAILGLEDKTGGRNHAVAWRRGLCYDPIDGQPKTLNDILKQYKILCIAFTHRK